MRLLNQFALEEQRTEIHFHYMKLINIIFISKFSMNYLVAHHKSKSVSVYWEFMFTRSMFETEDMMKQSELLNQVAQLIDDGQIKTTVSQVLSPINATNLIKAHQQIESGSTKGKIVLHGF